LRFGEIQVRDVDEFARLFGQGLGDGRVGVPERADGDAAAEVEVAFARDVEQITARAVAQDDLEASVAGHDVVRE